MGTPAATAGTRPRGTNMRRSDVVLSLALTTSFFAIAGCYRAPPPVEPGPVTVMVSTPIDREVTDFSDSTGHVAAVDSVEMRARVSGYLDKVNFKEGNI